MTNTLETYRDAGQKAGRAMRRRDVRLAAHHNAWLEQALRLEKPEDRQAARQAYNEAYREEARP